MLTRGSRDGRGDRSFGPPAVRFVDRLAGALPGATERVKAAAVVARAIVDGEQAKGMVMGLGTGDMASSIVSGIQAAVQRAMMDARAQIGSATDELVAEIKSGTANVKRAIQGETMKVRQQFGAVVGNATAAAEDAIAEVTTQTGASDD